MKLHPAPFSTQVKHLKSARKSKTARHANRTFSSASRPRLKTSTMKFCASCLGSWVVSVEMSRHHLAIERVTPFSPVPDTYSGKLKQKSGNILSEIELNSAPWLLHLTLLPILRSRNKSSDGFNMFSSFSCSCMPLVLPWFIHAK